MDEIKSKNVLYSNNYIIKYKKFDKNRRIFIDVSLINTINGSVLYSPLGLIKKIESGYYIKLTSAKITGTNTVTGDKLILLYTDNKMNPFFKHAFIT